MCIMLEANCRITRTRVRYVCVCVCVRARLRACVHVCVRARVCTRTRETWEKNANCHFALALN